jgi:hypothetical protein
VIFSILSSRTSGQGASMSAYDPNETSEVEISPTTCRSVSTLPFLNLTISELQETSHWPTHRLNVMSQQRKSNWQHPNAYYGEREEPQHSATNECDTSRHPHPYRHLTNMAGFNRNSSAKSRAPGQR